MRLAILSSVDCVNESRHLDEFKEAWFSKPRVTVLCKHATYSEVINTTLQRIQWLIMITKRPKPAQSNKNYTTQDAILLRKPLIGAAHDGAKKTFLLRVPLPMTSHQLPRRPL